MKSTCLNRLHENLLHLSSTVQESGHINTPLAICFDFRLLSIMCLDYEVTYYWPLYDEHVFSTTDW